MNTNPLMTMLFVFQFLALPAVSMRISAAESPGEKSEHQIEQSEVEQDAAQRRIIEGRLRELGQAQAGTNRERSFTIKVVDQFNVPVVGVEIGGFFKTFKAQILPTGKMFDSTDIKAMTDVNGIAHIGPLNGGEFWIGIAPAKVPGAYDGDDSIIFRGNEPPFNDDRDRDPKRHAPGVDWVFILHKMEGPRPLLEQTSATVPLHDHNGDSAMPWTVWHRVYAHDVYVKGRELEAEPFADFKVRFWRDSSLPVTVENSRGFKMPSGEVRREVNNLASWWFEIEVVRGGLQSADVLPSDSKPMRSSTAPKSGYVDRVSWQGGADGERLSWPLEKTFWWKRTGKPTRYALIKLKPFVHLDSDHEWKLDVSMTSKIIINPAPDDRLIELPIKRDPTWIKGFSGELADAWIAEPAGDPDPTIEHVAPRAVP